MSALRAIFFTNPLIVLATIFFGSLNLIVSLFETDGRKQMMLARAWARVLLKVSGVKVKVEGLEHIDANSSYVFASNHCSYMDTPVVLANIPAQFRFLAKKELFKIPFLGHHLRRAGHIPVPRDNPRAALKTLAEAGRAVQERGFSLLIFPEGGRSNEGLQEFKEGVAYLSIKSAVRVVPVGIQGTSEVLPVGSLNVRPGHVHLRIGDPVPTAGLTLQDRAAFTQDLHDRVAALLGNPAYTQTK